MDVDLLNRIAGKLAALHGEEIYNLKLLEKQMAEAEKDVENMLNAIQAGIITASTKQRLTELEETKSQLEQQIIEEKIKKPVLTLEQIMFFLNQFKDTDINDEEQRKRLIAFGTTIMPGLFGQKRWSFPISHISCIRISTAYSLFFIRPISEQISVSLINSVCHEF